MSHDIDGEKAFVAAHESAWHQLGTTLDHSFTAEEAMKYGYLGGWNVRKSPEYTRDEQGNELIVPSRYAVLRDNPFTKGQIDVLGSVGDTYHVIQNEEHAALLDALVDESGAHFETAGSLDGGRKVFVTMKIPGHIKIGGVDRVDNYIAAVNSHDGSTKFTIMVTPIRVVCANTMNIAFRNQSHKYTVRHTRGAQKQLVGEARKALDMTFSYLDSFQAQAEELINTTMTQYRFEEIVTKEFGPTEDSSPAARTRLDRKVEEMIDLFTEANTQEGIRETAWAGLNALTEWYDHLSPVRGNDRENTRAMKSVMDPVFKNRALELMLQG